MLYANFGLNKYCGSLKMSMYFLLILCQFLSLSLLHVSPLLRKQGFLKGPVVSNYNFLYQKCIVPILIEICSLD